MITFWRVPESRNEQMRGGLDWVGAVLGTVGLAGITVALIEAHRRGPAVWLSATIGSVCLIARLVFETRVPSPMVPLRFFRSRNFSGANLSTLFLYTALNGLLLLFP